MFGVSPRGLMAPAALPAALKDQSPCRVVPPMLRRPELQSSPRQQLAEPPLDAKMVGVDVTWRTLIRRPPEQQLPSSHDNWIGGALDLPSQPFSQAKLSQALAERRLAGPTASSIVGSDSSSVRLSTLINGTPRYNRVNVFTESTPNSRLYLR